MDDAPLPEGATPGMVIEGYRAAWLGERSRADAALDEQRRIVRELRLAVGLAPDGDHGEALRHVLALRRSEAEAVAARYGRARGKGAKR